MIYDRNVGLDMSTCSSNGLIDYYSKIATKEHKTLLEYTKCALIYLNKIIPTKEFVKE